MNLLVFGQWRFEDMESVIFFDPEAELDQFAISIAKPNWSFLEAYASAYFGGHEISFGKQDNWYGPTMGGGIAYSNNAENIYSFRINSIEPLQIPLVLCH